MTFYRSFQIIAFLGGVCSFGGIHGGRVIDLIIVGAKRPDVDITDILHGTFSNDILFFVILIFAGDACPIDEITRVPRDSKLMS